MNRNDIGSLEVLVPENDKIQQKVASVLSLLDAKIETNTRINNNLEPANDNATSAEKEVA